MKQALIENYKESVKMTKALTSFEFTKGYSETAVREAAKREILETVFSKSEVLRFRNEALVNDNPESIKMMDEFEAIINQLNAPFGDSFPLKWEKDYVEEAIDLFLPDIKDEEKQEEFKKLAKKVIEITE